MDLAALLADPLRASVCHPPVNGCDALLAAAEHNGQAVFRIDLAGARDRHAALAAFADAMRFPDWFGHNWDALADCLDDLSWQPAPGYLLLVEHADAWRAAEEAEFQILLEILAAAVETWRERRIPFRAVVDLAADGLALLPPFPQTQ